MSKHEYLEGKLAESLASDERLLELAGAHRWSREAIEAHMAAELAAAPQATRWYALLRLVPVIMPFVAFGVMAVGVLNTFINPLIFFSAVAVFIALLVADTCLAKVKIRGPAEWKRMDLSVYQKKYGAIPKVATFIVRDARLFFPNAHWTVDVLVQNSMTLDPILYCDNVPVFVWDKNGKTVFPPT